MSDSFSDTYPNSQSRPVNDGLTAGSSSFPLLSQTGPQAVAPQVIEDTDTTSSLPTAQAAPTATTPEVQMQLGNMSAVELVRHLMDPSSNPDHALTLLLEEGVGQCKAPHPSGLSEATEPSRCLPIAVHTAYVAFGIFRRMMGVGGWSARIGEQGERFLERFLESDVLKECLKIQDEWAQAPTLESLLKLEPFTGTNFKDKIELGSHKPTKEGLLAIIHKMWDEAIHVQMVGGVLTYQGQTILCLRLHINPALYAYLICDPHARPELGRTSPALIVAHTRPIVVGYLWDIWKDSPENSFVSAQMLLHGSVMEFAPPCDDSDLSSDGVADAPQSGRPPLSIASTGPNAVKYQENPSPEHSKEEDDLTSHKKESEGLKTSKHRLQSEFGWQLGLQDHSIILPLVKPEDKTAVQGDTPAVSDVETSGQQSQVPVQEQQKNTPRARSVVDLSKKDIGWQLALQQQIGGIILPSKSDLHDEDELGVVQCAPISTLTTIQKKTQGRRDVASESGPSNSSRSNVQATATQQGLAKSLPTRRPETSFAAPQSVASTLKSPSHLPHASTVVGAPSPSHFSSEFGVLAKSQPECDYCFGISSDEEEIMGIRLCGHRICKDCLRRFLLTEIEKGTYPIACPACTLTGRLKPAVLDLQLMEDLKFSDVELQRFEKLAFQTLPVRIFCHNCRVITFQERTQRILPSIVKCTLCSHTFCWECHKGASEDQRPGDDHACKEKTLIKVVRSQAGRHCPGCQHFVPRKWDQSHHLVCQPSCGMHFCFRCGKVIADTAEGQDPAYHAQLHYTDCVLLPGGRASEKCTVQ